MPHLFAPNVVSFEGLNIGQPLIADTDFVASSGSLMASQVSIEDMNALAAARGGKCLSSEYVNTDTALTWQCAKGHTWENRPAKIKKGQWCPECAGKKQRSIEEMRAFAESRGGKCLSPEYKSLQSQLEWQCAKGHSWKAKPANVVPPRGSALLPRNTWCPKCAGLIVTREDLVALAEDRGGAFTSAVYTKARDKHMWRCCNGHEFPASPNSVKNGTWCPACNINFGEELTRIFIEAVFEAPFPKARPAFLRAEGAGCSLELDGYNESLSIAFEHHGAQHYRHVKHFHRTQEAFDAQRDRDRRKLHMCELNGVRLLVVPSIPDLTPLQNLPVVIAQQCRTLGLTTPRSPFEVEVDLGRIFRVSEFDLLKKLATERGGELLSASYLGGGVQLRWRCAEGHEWDATPSSVKLGTWCATCAGINPTEKAELETLAARSAFRILEDNWDIDSSQKRRLTLICASGHMFRHTTKQIKRGRRCPVCAEAETITIQDARALAEAHGGLCLSTVYVNSQAGLTWLCSEGHVWTASYSTVKIGHWCRKCRMKQMGKDKRKYTIEDMRALALARGGQCLSTEYETVQDELAWRCANGHEWLAVASSVIGENGTWCQECSNKQRGVDQRDTIENMQEIAKKRDGKCLSTEYVTGRDNLDWECAKGHKWPATPNNIKRGKWCPHCAGKAPLTLALLQEIAKSRGGKCLATQYKRGKDRLEWECAKGHTWFATAESVKGTKSRKGTWCRTCYDQQRSRCAR